MLPHIGVGVGVMDQSEEFHASDGSLKVLSILRSNILTNPSQVCIRMRPISLGTGTLREFSPWRTET
ncbi:hypothetical protein GX50_02705 [[Emmonsia] crescens]|uniref:Uncharacterized protein n=1 Tax=[Emmonsia] crescens TaxID=73230 RepID=A0A2B7ZNT1_9EURO|nr:hypothetical protein GX50_02705 [Emmonsia crescens]